MKKKIILYFIIIIIFFVSVISYMYFNPAIDNRDFDIEFKISSGEKDYSKFRNQNYSINEYSFNNQIFCNDFDDTKFIIHSIDREEDGKEKVIFVVSSRSEKNPIALVDYIDSLNNFRIFRI